MKFEPEMKKRKVNPFRVVIGYILGLSMVLAGVYYSSLTPLGPLPEALPYLKSNPQITVDDNTFLYVKPVDKPSDTGFIFYPGGRVDYRSYAPLARGLAEKGWPVAVVPMPLNLAVLGTNRAAAVISSHPEIARWIIGGHSLGGTMAAKFTSEHPEKIAGIVFLASYPGGMELAASDLPVLSIFGSEDGLITKTEWVERRDRFPVNTTWVEVPGGNHAGFGWYGKQDGDNPSGISLEEQTRQILQSVDQFMKTIVDSEISQSNR